MAYPTGMAPIRPASWLPDPLDDTLLRYWDGYRWTFNTMLRPRAPQPIAAESQSQAVKPSEPTSTLRPDIEAALAQTRGTLLGSMKEVNLLGGYLQPEERVLALCGAQGEGHGVLACTNRRLVFLFVGLLKKQVLQVDWDAAKHLFYNEWTRAFSVYTRKPTKRTAPVLAVRVASVEDARVIAQAAQAASAAPRLDVVSG